MNAHYIESASTATLAAAYQMRLQEDGYCVIPNIASSALIEELNRDLEPRFENTPFCKGDFYGETTKRFGSLLKHSKAVRNLVLQPLILALTRAILGPHCDSILLNLTQAIEIHPGAPMQFPHRDQDMWGGPKGEMEYLINVMWPLTPFTAENGGTVLWPNSHHEQEAPILPSERVVAAAMDTGSALVFLGSTLHAGGANRTDIPRRGIIVSYCLGWLRQFEAQSLIYPPEIARKFQPELADLIGYSIHRPNLGNYEGQSPAVLLENGAPEFLQAQDALRPEQQEFIEQMKRGGIKSAAELGT